jgi:hypothetical protein
VQKSYCQLKDRLITHVPKCYIGYGKTCRTASDNGLRPFLSTKKSEKNGNLLDKNTSRKGVTENAPLKPLFARV